MDPLRFLSTACREAAQAGGGLSKAWADVVALCRQPGVVDLGQGAPNFPGSAIALAAAHEALDKSVALNNYSPIPGLPELLDAIAAYYARKYDQHLKPTEILVTTSGTEALDIACKALMSPGEKALILNPSFPWYVYLYLLVCLATVKTAYGAAYMHMRFSPGHI